jgi:hypothetical protein
MNETALATWETWRWQSQPQSSCLSHPLHTHELLQCLIDPTLESSFTQCDSIPSPQRDEDNDEQGHQYVSYISPKTIVTETVYHFLRGSVYGAAYGMVTPFYLPGSAGYIREQNMGRFLPAPAFSSPRAIPSYATMIGSLLAWQRACCKTMEYSRGKADLWNDVFGYFMVVPYYNLCLTKYAVLHNRFVGGAILGGLLVANWP